MSIKLKFDRCGFWLGVYCKTEYDTARVGRFQKRLRHYRRRRICVSWFPFTTLVLTTSWRPV